MVGTGFGGGRGGGGPQQIVNGSLEAHLCSVHSPPQPPVPGANYASPNCTDGETEARQVAPSSRSRNQAGSNQAATQTQGCGFLSASFFPSPARDWIRGGPGRAPGGQSTRMEAKAGGGGQCLELLPGGRWSGDGGRRGRKGGGALRPWEGSPPRAEEGETGWELVREGPAGFGRSSSSRRRKARPRG